MSYKDVKCPWKHRGCPVNNTIIFGTHVIANIRTSFDFPNKRMAFNNLINFNQTNANANMNVSNVNDGCIERQVCQGDDWFDDRINTCIRNDCEHFWLFSYDSQTHRCILKGIHVLFVILFLIMAFFEISYVYLRKMIENKALSISTQV